MLVSSPGRRLWIALAMVCWGAPAFAQQPSSGSPGLDRLMRIPEAVGYSTDEKGGAPRAEWRKRFGDARNAVSNAERTLAASQSKLATVAESKSDWQFSPPGVPSQPSQDSSSNFQLRELVRRQRGELDRARARLRELNVQANLAGVPEEWRGPSTEARSSDGPGDGSGTGATPQR